MKRTKDELLTALNALLGEDNTSDAAIAMIEDISDSFDAAPTEPDAALLKQVEDLQGELEAWKRKYRDRFLGKPTEEDDETESETEAEAEKPDGDKITIKDIFKKKED
jgi:hypothetical protein